MRPPSAADVAELGEELGLDLADDQLADWAALVADRLGALEAVEAHRRPQRPPRDYAYAERGRGRRPTAEEDPNNAWITKCRIDGAEDGPLSGITVGLKDNISVAGVELTNGSRVMEGYVPTVDATVVTRLLDAGATIEGKNNMWGFSVGDSDFGHVRNPAAPEHSIGGSSSGTAAAVAAGEVDVGMGGDQGGSVRIPAAFGGLVGVKPTHGLVPYTGILGADASIDHTGPLTRDVRTAALALEALAGRDGLDPRQPHDLAVEPYADALDRDAGGMTVGVLQEGFAHEGSDPELLETVRAAIDDLAETGVSVREVSVPEHEFAGTLTSAIVRYGYGQILEGRGVTTGASGWYDTGAAAFLHRALAANAGDLPASVTGMALASAHVKRSYGAGTYAKAQNLTAETRRAYDEVLADVDALVMPTVPIVPPEYGGDRDLEALLASGGADAIAHNTLPFNSTHHPAVTVPCGEAADAPVGMMFVGERFDEATLLALARAVERTRE